ncbi:hypothetical protein IE984_13740 [Klebsiella pneumoniae]|nr:hypothetical protein [Klebsiella pneumoniae]
MYVPAGLLLPDGAALIRPGESPAGSRHVGPASNSAAGRYIDAVLVMLPGGGFA